MLIDPASNRSVPFTVVMRTRSRVPERVLEPAPLMVQAADVTLSAWADTHKLEPIVCNDMSPDGVSVLAPADTRKPEVAEV